MNKWIAEFELEDGDTMPEHMDLEYKGVRIDFHCKPQKQDPCNTCGYEEGSIYCKEHCPHEAKIEQESCEDAISREWLKIAIHNFYHGLKHTPTEEDIQAYIDAAPPVNPQPCDDAISRQAVIDLVADYDLSMGQVVRGIHALPPVTPQPKTEQFAKWVATEIFDDMWEYNKDAFSELACRKLAKLGIVRAKGDEWELIEP